MSYEIRQTKFNDPDQKSGQHTNGHENIFVREDDSCPWYWVDGIKSRHEVKKVVECLGWEKFIRTYCQKVVD